MILSFSHCRKFIFLLLSIFSTFILGILLAPLLNCNKSLTKLSNYFRFSSHRAGQPRMTYDVSESDSLFWVNVKHTIDQILKLGGVKVRFLIHRVPLPKQVIILYHHEINLRLFRITHIRILKWTFPGVQHE